MAGFSLKRKVAVYTRSPLPSFDDEAAAKNGKWVSGNIDLHGCLLHFLWHPSHKAQHHPIRCFFCPASQRCNLWRDWKPAFSWNGALSLKSAMLNCYVLLSHFFCRIVQNDILAFLNLYWNVLQCKWPGLFLEFICVRFSHSQRPRAQASRGAYFRRCWWTIRLRRRVGRRRVRLRNVASLACFCCKFWFPSFLLGAITYVRDIILSLPSPPFLWHENQSARHSLLTIFISSCQQYNATFCMTGSPRLPGMVQWDSVLVTSMLHGKDRQWSKSTIVGLYTDGQCLYSGFTISKKIHFCAFFLLQKITFFLGRAV